MRRKFRSRICALLTTLAFLAVLVGEPRSAKALDAAPPELGNDEVVLIDGTIVRGVIVETRSGKFVTVSVLGETRQLAWDEVAEVRKGKYLSQDATSSPHDASTNGITNREAVAFVKILASGDEEYDLYRVTESQHGFYAQGGTYERVCPYPCNRWVDNPPMSQFILRAINGDESRRFTLQNGRANDVQVGRFGKVTVKDRGAFAISEDAKREGALEDSQTSLALVTLRGKGDEKVDLYVVESMLSGSYSRGKYKMICAYPCRKLLDMQGAPILMVQSPNGEPSELFKLEGGHSYAIELKRRRRLGLKWTSVTVAAIGAGLATLGLLYLVDDSSAKEKKGGAILMGVGIPILVGGLVGNWMFGKNRYILTRDTAGSATHKVKKFD